MEQDNLLEPFPLQKIYKPRAISLGVLFGGPLVAGYLISENFKIFGEPDKAKKALIGSIAFTVALVLALLFIPALEKAPGISFSFIYVLLASAVVKNYQEADIKKHLSLGGAVQSNWRVVFISLIGLIITVAEFVMIAAVVTQLN